MFSNIPRSPSHSTSTFIPNTVPPQGTTTTQQIKITPIISANKSTPIKDKAKIFPPTPNTFQSGYHGQRFSATQLSIPSSNVVTSQIPQIHGRFFMSPQSSEKRLHSQESIRTTFQNTQVLNSNNLYTSPDLHNFQPQSPSLHIHKTQQFDTQKSTNIQGQIPPQPLIQSLVFQPSQQPYINGDQIRGVNENIDINNDFNSNFPFKPTQESKFEVIENQNTAYSSQHENGQYAQMQAKQDEDQCRALAAQLIAEHKRTFEDILIQNAQTLKTDTTENQKKLDEIKEAIAHSKNDILSKLSTIYQEKYESIAQEQAQIQKRLHEYEQSIKVKVEEQYLAQMGKQMNDQISKLVQTQWEEAELGVQKQIQGLQKFLSGFDEKQSQAFIEVGDYLTKLKADIEKVFFEGQGYFKANLDAFGLNLVDKINTSDVKSVFLEMNEGFYDKISTGFDSLKVRTDAMSGNIKAMEEEQAKKLEQLEQQLSGYFSSLANGVEKLEDTQKRADQVIISYQNASQSIQQYKNKIDILESIVRNLVLTQKNSQTQSDNSLQNKFDKLVEALSKMQENFKQLKQKYEQESNEWKKYQNQSNTTLNDSKVSGTNAQNNLSTQSIASFNSQLIQLTNQNKQLMESMKFKEQMIQEQKMLIESFEKKIATQQQQLTSLVKELKQIKQESKNRQNVIQEANNSMFSSIQSTNGHNHSIADSLQNDFVNNVQTVTTRTGQASQLPYDFNQLEDYQEDQDDGYFDDEQVLYEDIEGTTETQNNEKEIQNYFRKLRTEETNKSNPTQPFSQYEQDFFFYPHDKQEQLPDGLLTQTSEVNLRDLKTLSTQQSQSFKQTRQSLLQTQQANLFTKKPINGLRQSLRPKRTLPNRGTVNTEPNIENHQPSFKSPTSSISVTKMPISKDTSLTKDLSIQTLKTEGNSTSLQNSMKQIISPSNKNFSQNCFSQPLKNINNPTNNQIPQSTVSTLPSQQDQCQSMSSQASINAGSNTNDLSHLIKRRLLYNNTLKEQKEQKLKVKLEENNRLKDEFGKFIYDKNGQALQFTAEQLEFLHQEAQVIEIININ